MSSTLHFLACTNCTYTNRKRSISGTGFVERKASIIKVLIYLLTTDLNHLSPNVGVGMPEACFIFNVASLPLCPKVAVKHQPNKQISEPYSYE